MVFFLFSIPLPFSFSKHLDKSTFFCYNFHIKTEKRKHMKLNKNLKGSLFLGIASLVWGFAFVVQSALADTVPPFLLNSLRSLISVAFLSVILWLKQIKTGAPIFPKEKSALRHPLIAGLVCGLLLTYIIFMLLTM